MFWEPAFCWQKPNQTTGKDKMDESSMSFSNFGLPKEINGAIKDLGYKAPTPIQAQTLPHSLNGEDIIGQAQTGTGKTAAFLISILTYELENPPEEDRPPGSPFALIIAPTRELVLQIQKDAMMKQLIKFPKLYYAKSSFPLEISQRAFDFLWRICESYELWCKESKQSELIKLDLLN